MRRKSNQGSVFGAIVVILCVLMLIGLSGALYWEKERVTQEFLADKEALQKDAQAIKEQLFRLQKEKEKSEQALLESEKKVLIAKEQYEKLENQYNEALSLKQFLVEKLQEITSNTMLGVKKIEAMSSKVDSQFARLSRLNSTDKDRATLFGNKGKKEDTIELPPVVISEKKEAPVVGKKKDENEVTHKVKDILVMSINAEHDFVVVNKGLVDGIKIGQRFMIMRETQNIAKVTITEMRDFVSLGTIEEITGGMSIREGDRLTYID